MDEYTESLLRPDNYDLFENVCWRLRARPVEPIDSIALDVGVTVDDLCRWVLGFREKGRPKAPYQSRKFAALRPPVVATPDPWADDEDRRRQRFAQKARDGAREARMALEKSSV